MYQKEYPKVSAFIAVYQQVDFIREAIDSVLIQDYPNLEIIIGDDGSTDGTQEILKDYQQKYPTLIKLILSKENTGITANCNRIFKECTGKYIAFLAGDDIWLPGKIRTQVDYMENHPECSICYHNLEVFDNDSGSKIGNFNNSLNPPRTGKADVLIRHGCFNGAVANMVRRSNCPDYGFDQRIPIASDWLFWIEILLDDGEIHYIDKVLGRYRVRKGSASNQKTEKILNNFVDHLNTLNILLVKKPVYYKDIFFRMFEIYNTLSVYDTKNKPIYKTICTSSKPIYKTICTSRKFFFLANAFAKLRQLMGFKR